MSKSKRRKTWVDQLLWVSPFHLCCLILQYIGMLRFFLLQMLLGRLLSNKQDVRCLGAILTVYVCSQEKQAANNTKFWTFFEDALMNTSSVLKCKTEKDSIVNFGWLIDWDFQRTFDCSLFLGEEVRNAYPFWFLMPALFSFVWTDGWETCEKIINWSAEKRIECFK